jgi:hypothetical protein
MEVDSRLVVYATAESISTAGRLGSEQTARFCQAVPRGDIRLTCVSARRGWLPRAAISTSREWAEIGEVAPPLLAAGTPKAPHLRIHTDRPEVPAGRAGQVHIALGDHRDLCRGRAPAVRVGEGVIDAGGVRVLGEPGLRLAELLDPTAPRAVRGRAAPAPAPPAVGASPGPADSLAPRRPGGR